VVPPHARRSHRARGSGFTDPWHNGSDLCERRYQVLFGHVLDMIMLRSLASAEAVAWTSGRAVNNRLWESGRPGRDSSGTRVHTTPDALTTSTAATRPQTRSYFSSWTSCGSSTVRPPPPAGLTSNGGPSGGVPVGRNVDRRARSDNARPIKVRTPAPGFNGLVCAAAMMRVSASW
jgi:hypothetical protein